MKKFALLIIGLIAVNIGTKNFSNPFFSVKDPKSKSKTTRSAQKCTVNTHPANCQQPPQG